jgi:hypothetical protein
MFKIFSKITLPYTISCSPSKLVFALSFSVIFISSLLISHNASAQRKLSYRKYNLVFKDEFDTYSSVADLLKDRWLCQNSKDPLWGWGDEYYEDTQVALLKNVPGASGVVRLQAERLPQRILDPTGRKSVLHPDSAARYLYYKSGKLELKEISGDCNNAEGYKYGIFEMRAKLPADDGAWPAFWLWSGPQGTQITAIDNFNSSRTLQMGVFNDSSLYYNGTDKRDNAVIKEWQEPGYFSNSFHTFTLVWEPSPRRDYNKHPAKVSYYVDGRWIVTIDNIKTPGFCAKIFMNLQMGSWAKEDPSQLQMDIDYIRVYKRKGSKLGWAK